MCFLCLVVFSVLVDGGSKVNVALGPEKEGVHISFVHVLAACPPTSNPGKNVVFGNFEEADWLAFLHANDVKEVCTDAIAGTT